MELCVTKLSQDWFPLLELLAMATNPHCKFHIYNGTRPSETVPAGVQLAEDELFARPPDPRSPKVRWFSGQSSYSVIFEIACFQNGMLQCMMESVGNVRGVLISQPDCNFSVHVVLKTAVQHNHVKLDVF